MPEVLAGSFIYMGLLPVVLGGLAVAYLGLRLRDARAELPDPELGIKSAYHAFLTAGLLIALTGLSIAAIDLLADAFEDPNNRVQQPQPQFNPGRFPPPPPAWPVADDPFDSVSQRLAWSLVISGVLSALVSLLLVKAGTNDRQYPAARRAFGGVRLVVGGLTVIAAGTLLVELLFQKNPESTRPFAVAVGLLAVWFPASAVQVFLLKRDARLPYYVPPKPKKKRESAEDDGGDEDGDRRREPPRRRPEADEPRGRAPTDEPPRERRDRRRRRGDEDDEKD